MEEVALGHVSSILLSGVHVTWGSISGVPQFVTWCCVEHHLGGADSCQITTEIDYLTYT